MTNNRTILITGVTGNQGGAVAQALQGSGFHLRGLTRKPDSERAAALARHGVDIVKGDLDDVVKLLLAVDDSGWFRARELPDAAALNRRQIDIAGDVRTTPEGAEILTEAFGRTIA